MKFLEKDLLFYYHFKTDYYIIEKMKILFVNDSSCEDSIKNLKKKGYKLLSLKEGRSYELIFEKEITPRKRFLFCLVASFATIFSLFIALRSQKIRDYWDKTLYGMDVVKIQPDNPSIAKAVQLVKNIFLPSEISPVDKEETSPQKTSSPFPQISTPRTESRNSPLFSKDSYTADDLFEELFGDEVGRINPNESSPIALGRCDTKEDLLKKMSGTKDGSYFIIEGTARPIHKNFIVETLEIKNLAFEDLWKTRTFEDEQGNSFTLSGFEEAILTRESPYFRVLLTGGLKEASREFVVRLHPCDDAGDQLSPIEALKIFLASFYEPKQLYFQNERIYPLFTYAYAWDLPHFSQSLSHAISLSFALALKHHAKDLAATLVNICSSNEELKLLCKKRVEEFLGNRLTVDEFKIGIDFIKESGILPFIGGLDLSFPNRKIGRKIGGKELSLLKDLPIEGLSLNEMRIYDQDAPIFKEFKGLKKLNLSGCRDLTDLALFPLKELPLLELDISSLKHVTNEGLKYLPRSLQKLTLSHLYNLNQEALKLLPSSIQILNLNSFYLERDSLALLKDFPLIELNLEDIKGLDGGLMHLPKSIRKLILSPCPKLKDLEPLKDFPHLIELSLSSEELEDEGLKFLPNSLKILRLKGCPKLTAKGIRLLSSLPLIELDLQWNHITGGLQDLPLSLQKLNLAFCNLTDEALIDLKRLSRLIELNLCRSNIRDETLKNLPESLQKLDVSLCRALTDTALSYLKNLPKLIDLDLSQLENLTDKAFENLPPSLQKLHTSSLNMTDRALIPLKNLPLVELELFNQNFTSEGLLHLPDSLKKLSFRCCGNIKKLGPLQNLPLLDLDMTQHRINKIEEEELQYLPRSIEKLNMAYMRTSLTTKYLKRLKWLSYFQG